MAKKDPFFKPPVEDNVTSLYAKLLLPMKTLCYGVAAHTFQDYFPMSTTNARVACNKFDIIIAKIYMSKYMRLPTKADLISINQLHKEVHGVAGLIGSLDCMHATWKNCHKALQQSYRGKDKKK